MSDIQFTTALTEIRPFASKAEAEAGTDQNKAMNPLRVKEAIDKLSPPMSNSAIRDLLKTLQLANRLPKSAIWGADFALNYQGYEDMGQYATLAISFPYPLKGDFWRHTGDGFGMSGDWYIALADVATFGLAEYATTDWLVIPFGYLEDLETLQTALDAINEYERVSLTEPNILNVTNVVTEMIKFQNTTTEVKYITFLGAGKTGMHKKIWIEQTATASYSVQLVNTAAGSPGIFIPGAPATITYRGDTTPNVFLEAVWMATNQWMIINISTSSISGPKTNDGTLHLDGTEPFVFLENTVYIPVICDSDVTITLGTGDHLNGVTHFMSVTSDENSLDFSTDFEIVSGVIDTDPGAINIIQMTYDIVNAKVMVTIFNKVTYSKYASIGDGINTTYFDRTGHQIMFGTAKPWEDLRIHPIVRITSPTTYNPTWEKWFDNGAGSSGLYLYSFEDGSTEKEVMFEAQMPHAWDGGTISIHLHWIPSIAATDKLCLWGLEYNMKSIGQVFGNSSIVYATSLFPNDTDYIQYKHYISEFADITPGATQNGISSILLGRIFRKSNDASDTYTGKAGLLYIDIHYQLNSLGSTDEYSK